jgi:type II secretory pathway pseudopilin PulG
MTRQRNPRGVSLLETVVAFSLISVLLLISAGWIHQTMRFASIMQQRQEQHQGLLRLSRQLRDDVHYGETVQIDSDQVLVIQGSDGRQTIYTTDAQRLIRQTRSETELESEDSFPLASGTELNWDGSQLPDWITLAIAGTPPGSDTSDGDTSDGDKRTGQSVSSGAVIHQLHLRIAVNRYGDRVAQTNTAAEVDDDAAQGDAP